MSNLFRKKEKFYLPGEEIKVSKSAYSKGRIEENDPMTICRRWILVAITIMVASFLTITVRTFSLCISGYEPKSETDEIKPLPQVEVKSNTKRADVTDRNNTVIATSIPTINLGAHPRQIQNKKEVALRLSKYFDDLSYEDILSKLSKDAKFVYIKRDISLAQKYDIYALGITGLEFNDNEKRIYPHEKLFAHVLGKVSVDNNAQSGIERGLNKRITTSEIPLQLSVDTGIQDTVREKLYRAMEKYQAIGATAILMDVNTGEIISMVSLPDFNPNNEAPNSNIATQKVYEPGSVMKVFNTAIGLESGKVNLKEKFDATKPLVVSKYDTIKDYRGENRWLDLQEILVHSSNIGSARVALRIGRDIQKAYLENFGFSEKIENFEIAEKEKPIFPQGKWQDGTVATVGYGHGISVTPLHLVSAFSAVVNGGTYYNPTLIKQQGQPQGRKILTTETSEKMRKLLRAVVTKGSGKNANVIGYEVAGKTGTAAKIINGKYANGVNCNSFLATFPASNPKYALLVVIDEPKASEETKWFATSGWNAVPTAGEIIATIAPQLNLRANYDIDDKRMKMIEASYNM